MMKAQQHPAGCEMKRSMACFSRDISGNELHWKGEKNVIRYEWFCPFWVLTHVNERASAVLEFSLSAINLQNQLNKRRERFPLQAAPLLLWAIKPNLLLCWSYPWLCPIFSLQVNTFISFVFPMVVISVLNTIIANQLLVMFKQAAQENQVCTIGGQQTMLSMSMEPSRVQALKHGVRVLREYPFLRRGTAGRVWVNVTWSVTGWNWQTLPPKTPSPVVFACWFAKLKSRPAHSGEANPTQHFNDFVDSNLSLARIVSLLPFFWGALVQTELK